VYDGKVVEVATPVESVTLPGAVNEQATLASNGFEPEKVCGGESLVINNALLWKSSDRSFIIFGRFDNHFGEGYITRMDMIRIAKTLNGIDTSGEQALDPQRLFSVRDAEIVTGTHVLAPAEMLTSLHLDHITYRNGGDSTMVAADGWPVMIATLYTRESPSNVSRDRIMITQVPHAGWTLAQREREGGYKADKVRGQPALYQEFCWQSAGVPGCHQTLIWLEGDTGYELLASFPALLTKETLFSLVESLR